jgi:hypothetical protein
VSSNISQPNGAAASKVKTTEQLGIAAAAMAACTNAVVAMLLSLSLAAGVGAFGSPLKNGEVSGANTASRLFHAAF